MQATVAEECAQQEFIGTEPLFSLVQAIDLGLERLLVFEYLFVEKRWLMMIIGLVLMRIVRDVQKQIGFFVLANSVVVVVFVIRK